MTSITDPLPEHPWILRVQKLNKQYEKQTKWYKRMGIDFKSLYIYLRHRKERLDYTQQLKEHPVEQIHVFQPKK